MKLLQGSRLIRSGPNLKLINESDGESLMLAGAGNDPSTSIEGSHAGGTSTKLSDGNREAHMLFLGELDLVRIGQAGIAIGRDQCRL